MFSLGFARASKWPMYSFYINQEINALWSEDYIVTHRLNLMNAYNSILSEIVIISPVNRRFLEHQKLWRNMKHSERTFIYSKILWDTKESPFQHGTEHTQSVRLKAVPQSDFNGWTYILKNQWIPNWTEKSHIHAHKHTHMYTHPKC
jgi:hypothetical protein